MSSGAITKDGNTHLTSSITVLLLIRNVCGWINTENTVAVGISTNIGVIAAWESCIACIIAISSSPVVATEGTNIGEEITILIKDWSVSSEVTNIGNPVADAEFVIREVVLCLYFSNMLFELNLSHTGT